MTIPDFERLVQAFRMAVGEQARAIAEKALMDAIRGVERDAERWRIFRDRTSFGLSHSDFAGLWNEEADAAIDAARAQEGGSGG